MNINLFLKELERNRSALMVWTIVITVLLSVTMAVFPTFIENQSKIAAMLTIVPKEMLQFKGISNFEDILSPLGFYAANNVIYMMVLGSIYSIVLSSGILLKEEYNKTAEYLLTRPLTRSEIFLSKFAVVSLDIFILNLVTSLAGFISMALVQDEPVNISVFLILSTYTLLLNFLFGATGLFLSTLVKRAKPITTFTIGLVLILYFIYTISKITPGISKIGYLSPFRFARVDALDPSYSLNLLNLFYFIGLSALFTVFSFRIYRRKDIYT
jgi:ABC-2 type transport system permease protein